jgi:adenylate cyclase, class 2
MAIETEKKYRLDSARRLEILDALSEAGAEFEREDFEINTIFGGGPLDENNAVLRIRTTQSGSFLTYKKRIENRFEVKQQMEIESRFEDPEALKEILENLGLEARLVYEKRRRTWRFRSVEVVLDELPFGLFMEIEGTITAIKEAEMFLGIEDLETEHETYPRLTLRLGKRNGDVVEARFDPSNSKQNALPPAK